MFPATLNLEYKVGQSLDLPIRFRHSNRQSIDLSTYTIDFGLPNTIVFSNGALGGTSAGSEGNVHVFSNNIFSYADYATYDLKIIDNIDNTNISLLTGTFRVKSSDFYPTDISQNVFWWSASEGFVDDNLMTGTNGLIANTSSNQGIATIFPTSVKPILGPELVTVSAEGKLVKHSTNSIYYPGVSVTVGKYYIIEAEVISNPGNTSATFRINGSSNWVSTIGLAGSIVGRYKFIAIPVVSGSVSVASDNTGCDMTLKKCSIKEILNYSDLSLLLQSSATLRLVSGFQPVSTTIRNLRGSNPATTQNQNLAIGCTQQLGLPDARGGNNAVRLTTGTVQSTENGYRITGGSNPTGAGNILNSVMSVGLDAKAVDGRWLVLRNIAIINGGPTAVDAAWFDLQNGTIGQVGSGLTANISPIENSNGWYRCTITGSVGPSIVNDIVDIRLVANNATMDRPETPVSIDIDLYQLEVGQPSNPQRRDNNALKVEETGTRIVPMLRSDLNDDKMQFSLPSTNLIRYPESPATTSIWGASMGIYAATALNNAEIAPDGTMTAAIVTYGGQYKTLQQNLLTTITDNYASAGIWIKRLSGNYNLHLAASTSHEPYMEPITITDDWVFYKKTWEKDGSNNFAQFSLQDRNVSGWGQIAVWHPQMNAGPELLEYQGDLVGSGIVAGRAGIWEETVRNPRLVTLESQAIRASGYLLPGSSTLGLPGVIHGDTNALFRGFTDLLLYDRILTEAEKNNLITFLMESGAGKYWNPIELGPNLITNSTFDTDISGYASVIADLSHYNSNSLSVVHNNPSNGGRARWGTPIIKPDAMYYISIDFIGNLGDAIGARIQVGDISVNVSNAPTIPTKALSLGTNSFFTGTYTVGTAPIPLGHIGFFATGGTTAGGGGAIFDNIIVREVIRE